MVQILAKKLYFIEHIKIKRHIYFAMFDLYDNDFHSYCPDKKVYPIHDCIFKDATRQNVLDSRYCYDEEEDEDDYILKEPSAVFSFYEYNKDKLQLTFEYLSDGSYLIPGNIYSYLEWKTLQYIDNRDKSNEIVERGLKAILS